MNLSFGVLHPSHFILRCRGTIPCAMRRNRVWFATAISAVLCLATCVLWVRGYAAPYELARHDFATRPARVEVSGGRLLLASDVTDSSRFVYPRVGPSGEFAGFGYTKSTLGKRLTVPLWFLLLV